MSGAGALDTTQAEKKVWLVKLPPMVAQRLRVVDNQSNAADGAGTPIGRVRITHNATENTSEFRIELEGGSFADIPKEFNMRPHAGSSQSMYSFSEDTGYVSVDGRIDQQFDVEMLRTDGPKVDPKYRSLTRNRQHAAATKTRVMQVIDDPRNLLMRPLPSAVTKRKADKATDNKRLRMDKDQLENMLFTLFEKQSTWNFTQLQRETDQPAPWLKEVLNEVAILNKTGPNRDKWEVKKEFRNATSDAKTT